MPNNSKRFKEVRSKKLNWILEDKDYLSKDGFEVGPKDW